MAKRFIDTKMWDKAWFRKLSPKYKAVWLYLLTRCDHAGIWDADWEAAEFLIGESITYDDLPEAIKTKMKPIKNEDQFFIESFVEFQYGVLKENSKPHLSVIKRLNEKGLLKGIQRVLSENITPKDKDKVKDKVKDKEKREMVFIEKCKKLQSDVMSDVELVAFIDYWTESNDGSSKMKFEMQKTFDISRRMKRWQNNNKDWGKNKNSDLKFDKLPYGLWKAYCMKCGTKNMPNDYQLKQNVSCCGVEYLPEKPQIKNTSKADKEALDKLGLQI